ncbi:hypothetical protein BH10CYA1_BH10CYA1_48510 [soil metagenome]
MTDRVIEHLSTGSLKELIAGDVLAIRVSSFLSPKQCQLLTEVIQNSSEFQFEEAGFVGLGPGSFTLPSEQR